MVLPPASGDTLRGLPASGGVVEGRVRVLRGPDHMGELVPGEILVVHTTDVGWTPLFPLAAGVVTELGGPLSHAAVVAREFGVPSVVNVPGVTRALKTGDLVRVDGDRGVVERLVTAAGEGPLVALVGDAAAIAEGRVFVGRKRVQDASFTVKAGDEVTLAAPAKSQVVDVPVLARIGDFLALAKPAGIPTIPDHGGASHTLLAHAARIAGLPPAAVHPTSRLDREVSGVVVFALSPLAAARMKDARDEGAYARRYVAIAARAPARASGLWDARIGRAKDPRKRQVDGRESTDARTRYALVATAPGGQALLALAPETGRTHQLRVHAAHAGAPLLGDRAYGGPPRITLPGGRVLALDRVYLHCARVVACGLDVVAPVPAELETAWASLGGAPADWERAASLDV